MAYRPDFSVNVRLDDVLTQAAKNLHLSATVPTLPLERITTISSAISAVGNVLVGTTLDKTICLSAEEEKRQRKYLLRTAARIGSLRPKSPRNSYATAGWSFTRSYPCNPRDSGFPEKGCIQCTTFVECKFPNHQFAYQRLKSRLYLCENGSSIF